MWVNYIYHSHLTLLYWLLLAALLPVGHGAYVQNKGCPGQDNGEALQTRFYVEGLGASLDATQLELQVTGFYPGGAACGEVQSVNMTAGLTLSALGNSQKYIGEIVNSSCFSMKLPLQVRNQTYRQLQILYHIQHPPLLSSYELELELRGVESPWLSCVRAPLIPSIGTVLYWIALALPVTAFIVTFLAAVCGEMWINSHLNEGIDNIADERLGRGHLTRVADCLAYIQFIFFSGALTLQYPGFFRPMVSPSSWATLMLSKGPVFGDSLYHGIIDGIYEVNGTFGGTNGLEIMTQFMGAPVSMRTWTNIISLSGIILLSFAVIILLHWRLTVTHNRFRWGSQITEYGNYDAAIWTTLRAFLSYFLLPIVAWTTYQLDGAVFFPVYYTVATVLVVFILAAACWWAFTQSRPENMGYLIVGDLRKHQTLTRTPNFYTLVTFILLFARGAVIGGLQAFGTVQLITLIGCEAVQITIAAWTLPNFYLTSRNAFLVYVRTVILLLCLSMLPSIASHSITNVCGYVALAGHAMTLASFFLLPAVYEVLQAAVRLCHGDLDSASSDSGSPPQIYSIRQLKKRRTNPNFSSMMLNDIEFHTGAPSPQPRPRPSLLRLSSPLGRKVGLEEDVRPCSRFTSSSGSLIQQRDNSVSSDDRAASSGDDQDDHTSHSSRWAEISLANPNVDYSVREADLYYGRPRRLSFHQVSQEREPKETASTVLERFKQTFVRASSQK